MCSLGYCEQQAISALGGDGSYKPNAISHEMWSGIRCWRWAMPSGSKQAMSICKDFFHMGDLKITSQVAFLKGSQWQHWNEGFCFSR